VSVLSSEPKWGGGGQHSLAGEGAGGANSVNWRESLAFCILYSVVDTEDVVKVADHLG
jgi:hypothetical protein